MTLFEKKKLLNSHAEQYWATDIDKKNKNRENKLFFSQNPRDKNKEI